MYEGTIDGTLEGAGKSSSSRYPRESLTLPVPRQRRYSETQFEGKKFGFLEKTQTFEKSLLRDNNLVEFFFPSRLNDPDEQNWLPIGYLFARRWAMTLPSPTEPAVIGLLIIFYKSSLNFIYIYFVC